MSESRNIVENLKQAIAEMTRIRNGELPKESYEGMIARIRKQIADDEREE